MKRTMDTELLTPDHPYKKYAHIDIESPSDPYLGDRRQPDLFELSPEYYDAESNLYEIYVLDMDSQATLDALNEELDTFQNQQKILNEQHKILNQQHYNIKSKIDSLQSKIRHIDEKLELLREQPLNDLRCKFSYFG